MGREVAMRWAGKKLPECFAAFEARAVEIEVSVGGAEFRCCGQTVDALRTRGEFDGEGGKGGNAAAAWGEVGNAHHGIVAKMVCSVGFLGSVRHGGQSPPYVSEMVGKAHATRLAPRESRSKTTSEPIAAGSPRRRAAGCRRDPGRAGRRAAWSCRTGRPTRPCVLLRRCWELWVARAAVAACGRG